MPIPAVLGVGAIALMLRTLLMGVVAAVITKLPGIIKHLAVGLGLYFVVAKPAATGVKAMVADAFNGVPGTVLETLFYLNVDDYAVAIASAHAIVMSRQYLLKKRSS